MAVVQPADMAVKANEILARFRPIAPKPSSLDQVSSSSAAAQEGVVATNRVLRQLQSRPCRARKRGRPSLVSASPTLLPAAVIKRKTSSSAPAPPPPYPPLLRRCAATTDGVATTTAHVVVPGSPYVPTAEEEEGEKRDDVPVERDLLRKLLEPRVISPRAVRPVGSTIRVECIRRTDAATTTTCTTTATVSTVSKTAAEVEAELEADALPAVVVSDLGNRVRLVNEAYKEMVGQPECPWLRTVAAAASRRISGEVVLLVAGCSNASLPAATHGVLTTCTARIQWEYDGKCTSISVPCDVRPLQCESRDYSFTLRFRTSHPDQQTLRREE